MIRRRLVLGAAALPLAAVAVAPAAGSTSRPPIRFSATWVDQTLAGGEPTVFYDPVHHDYIYTAHEGTTHTLHDGVVEAPGETVAWATNYRNQVNIWTSTDGRSWQRVNLDGTGFFSNPDSNTGFSDPDLTQDAGGRIYNTGIDLVNDALFSSTDGGRSWPTGTANCHDGDRPWLAGGHANEVFLATDIAEATSGSGHTIFRSTDGGASCSATGIPDYGAWGGTGSYTGYGKLFYDRATGALVEPAMFSDASGNTVAVGVSVLANAAHAFDTGTGAFVPHVVAKTHGLLTLFPVVNLDDAGNLYLTWADNPNGSGKNSVYLAMSKDQGRTWTRPLVVAHPGTTVLWPWVVAGNPGNAAVTWYQYGTVAPSPDSQSTVGTVSVYEASIFGLGTRHVTKYVVDASGRPIHSGGICQSGTTCVVTGQDRRLGDYFTDNLDANGCVLIATGDTTRNDPVTGLPRAWSLPLFLRQDSGPSLTGRTCGRR